MLSPLLNIVRGNDDGVGGCASNRSCRVIHIFPRRSVSGFGGGRIEWGLERAVEHAKMSGGDQVPYGGKCL